MMSDLEYGVVSHHKLYVLSSLRLRFPIVYFGLNGIQYFCLLVGIKQIAAFSVLFDLKVGLISVGSEIWQIWYISV